MPNQPRKDNPGRAIRVPDLIWRAARERAAERGETVSAVVVRALAEYGGVDEARARAIRDARQHTNLEGTRSTDATRADQDAYVRGEIDLEQLGARVRARHRAG